MASAAQIAANQRNCLKSKGPTTPEGRARSSANALKHGLRSKKVQLFREESYAFEERLRKWMTSGDAQTDADEFLVYQNVCLSFDLDRAQRARIERCTSLIENSEEDEIAEAQQLGKRLLFDPAGPTPLYGNLPAFRGMRKKTSWNAEAVDPNDPAALVRILCRNQAGCDWLHQQWVALRELLNSVGFWQSHDRFKAIRLLGLQPVDAIDDRRVAEIFVASHRLKPVRKNEFDDLLSDLEEEQCDRYRKRLIARWPDLFRDREESEWRQMLADIADRNIERLSAKLEVHEENADVYAERTFARLAFDPSPEGQGLRNFQLKCTNALFRGLEHYRKHKSGTGGPSRGAVGAGRQRKGRYPGENLSEGQTADGSKLDVDSSSFSRDGHDDTLDWAYDSNPWPDQAAPSDCDTGIADHTLSYSAGIIPDTIVADSLADHDDTTAPASACLANDISLLDGSELGNDVAGAEDNSHRRNAAAGVESQPDEVSGRCEIPENATNEANFDACGGVVEAQASNQVTANPGIDSGLDKGVFEPGGAFERAQSPASHAKSGIGNPRSQSPDPGGGARKDRLQMAYLNRERRRQRRENERRYLERLIEEKRKAGDISTNEIIQHALALPP